MIYDKRYGAVIGVDVGNYDTKTTGTKTPNGYDSYNTKPILNDEIMVYNNTYYSPSCRRNPFVLDKRKNDQCLIMTLFGICKEILYTLEINNIPKKEWQKEVNEITKINIGLGLPPEHIQALGAKTHEYYDQKLKNEIEVIYKEIKFRFSMNRCAIYPQGIVSVIANDNCSISNEYDTYVIADIGGFTADIIQIDNGAPVYGECISLEFGVNVLFSNIAKRIKTETGTHIDNLMIENILLGKKSILSKETLNIISKETNKHVGRLFDKCREIGIDFKVKPCVFVGGGALLLRSFIDNQSLSKYEFIPDVCSNAKFYEEYLNETLEETFS